MEFETRAIHDGQSPEKSTGSVTVPIYQTSTFQQESVGKHKGYEYSRTGNPTRQALETALASLEEGKFGLAFSSGLAATDAVCSLLKSGDHIVAGNDIYGGTYRLFEDVYRKWGIDIDYADAGNADSFNKKIKDNTKLIWIESPTNPLLKVVDIRKIASNVRSGKIRLAVDNTFASPYLQKPLLLGADIVVHSTTKYLGGHSDVVGGAAITSDKNIYEKLKFYQNSKGAIPGIWDSWLVLRGVKTLAVRMKAHTENALYLAEYLNSHPKVERVYYPGLKESPYYELAKKQMSNFGGMVSFELKGGFNEVEKFFKGLKIFLLAESLGGVESLVCYPPGMTHGAIPATEREKRGIRDNLVRLSVGIENKDDLKEDLKVALQEV